MKNFASRSAFLLLSMGVLSCNSYFEQIPNELTTGSRESLALQDKLRPSLQKDVLVSRLNQVMDQCIVDVAYVRFGKVDWNYVRENQRKGQSLDDQKLIYKKAGMQNIDNYILQNTQLIYYMDKVIKKYPQMRKLTNKDRSLLLASTRNANPSLNKDLLDGSRRNSQSN